MRLRLLVEAEAHELATIRLCNSVLQGIRLVEDALPAPETSL
jgi:hypothetical protein